MTKIYWFLGHEQFQPEILVEHAKAAEKAGFDGVMISEHLQPWVTDKGAAGFAFSTLGAIATSTNKLELMTGVTTPLFRYHPAVVAQAAATIDRLSGGRFALGIGTGENINEGALGIKFPGYRERSNRIIEAIEIMSKLLGGEKLSFDGNYYQTRALKLYSPPLHKVPIYMAAGGPQSAITAAKYCDGVITSVRKTDETKINVIEPANNTNKNVQILASRWSIFADNEEDAWSALGAWRGLRAPSRATAIDPKTLEDEADTLSKTDILASYSRIKNIKDYITVYKPLITELKARVIIIQTTSLNQLDTIKQVGAQVLPELRIL